MAIPPRGAASRLSREEASELEEEEMRSRGFARIITVARMLDYELKVMLVTSTHS